jgi:hypothetical protein
MERLMEAVAREHPELLETMGSMTLADALAQMESYESAESIASWLESIGK